MIHEWWGLNDHIKHYADRFAKLGYAALAVDLFQKQVATTSDAAMKLVKSVDDARARQTLLAGTKVLDDRSPREGRAYGCRRLVLRWQIFARARAGRPRLECSGHLLRTRAHRPAALAKLKTPVLAIFGTRDASIPKATVDAFQAALDQTKVPHRVLSYDAEHAFANPSGERYDEKAAAAAWGETRTFLAQHLGAVAGVREPAAEAGVAKVMLRALLGFGDPFFDRHERRGSRGPSDARGVLPLTRVRLYEAGVAYFERSGTLGASAPVTGPAQPPRRRAEDARDPRRRR